MRRRRPIILIPVGPNTIGEMVRLEEALTSFRKLERLTPYRKTEEKLDRETLTFPADKETGAVRQVEIVKIHSKGSSLRPVYRLKRLIYTSGEYATPVSIEIMPSLQGERKTSPSDAAMHASLEAKRIIIPASLLGHRESNDVPQNAELPYKAGDVQKALITLAAQHIHQIGVDEPIRWQFAPFSLKQPFLDGRYLGSNRKVNSEITLLKGAPAFIMGIVASSREGITAELYDSDASDFNAAHLTKGNDPISLMGHIQLIEQILSDFAAEDEG